MATLYTDRLTLRPWHDDDAEALYLHASDPEVGNAAGWPPHSSVEMSRMVIREYFSAPETYAIVLKETGKPVGCCGLVPPGARPNARIAPDEAEIGYWIGKSYWGLGLATEAVKALMSHATATLDKKALWIGCYHSNHRSARVAEKCGYIYGHATDEEVFFKHSPQLR